MSMCAVCGLSSQGEIAVCAFHLVAEDNWAAANRIFCDWLHRGILPPRLSLSERDDDALLGADLSGGVLELVAEG